MIHTKSQPVHDILLAWLRAEGLETPLLEYRVVQAWPEVMGEVISRYTRQVFVKDGKLQVQLTSPSLRQNLMMEHKRIAQKLNDHVGAYVVSDVCFF
jgi:predicted nucleic acid-binding Zn ribbon protein